MDSDLDSADDDLLLTLVDEVDAMATREIAALPLPLDSGAALSAAPVENEVEDDEVLALRARHARLLREKEKERLKREIAALEAEISGDAHTAVSHIAKKRQPPVTSAEKENKRRRFEREEPNTAEPNATAPTASHRPIQSCTEKSSSLTEKLTAQRRVYAAEEEKPNARRSRSWAELLKRFSDGPDGVMRPEDGVVAGIRLRNINGRKTLPEKLFVRLSEVASPSFAPSSDYFTIGVLSSKSKAQTSNTKSKYCIAKLVDLSRSMTIVNIFLWDDAVSLGVVGDVVGICNAKVLTANEKNKCSALSVETVGKWIKIGDARDLGACKWQKHNKSCEIAVNVSHGEYCEEHSVDVFKAARLNRQEFASGTQVFAIGMPTINNPTLQHRSGNHRRSTLLDKTEASYTLSTGLSLSTHQHTKTISMPCRLGREKTREEKKEIQSLMETKTPGGRYLRAARDIANGKCHPGEYKKPLPSKCIFNQEAVRRMGGDPVLGIEFFGVNDDEQEACAKEGTTSTAKADCSGKQHDDSEDEDIVELELYDDDE
ncbi:hypothetical protein BC832DRAFT_547961 [Gaertneriomyces semiglobifer]|nr:hypothetical protein BC832DRAFT_547961 [Gaertneriomyces semiglobifer]